MQCDVATFLASKWAHAKTETVELFRILYAELLVCVYRVLIIGILCRKSYAREIVNVALDS